MGGRACLLVVEEDPALSGLLRECLIGAGYRVAETDGAWVADSLAHVRFDLVVAVAPRALASGRPAIVVTACRAEDAPSCARRRK